MHTSTRGQVEECWSVDLLASNRQGREGGGDGNLRMGRYDNRLYPRAIHLIRSGLKLQK